jgi:uncharacterized alkaline shock family protein YloU
VQELYRVLNAHDVLVPSSIDLVDHGSEGSRNITGGASRTRGLSVDVGERQTAADITINVEYGRSIPQVAQAVRERIIERVQSLTGLEVTEVNIQVNDVDLPES